MTLSFPFLAVYQSRDANSPGALDLDLFCLILAAQVSLLDDAMLFLITME